MTERFFESRWMDGNYVKWDALKGEGQILLLGYYSNGVKKSNSSEIDRKLIFKFSSDSFY